MEEYLKSLLSDINSGSDRVELIDHEHLLDTKTNLKFHLYDPMDQSKKMHVTKDGVTVASEQSFVKKDLKEADLLTEIRSKLVEIVTKRERSKLKDLISKDYSQENDY